MSLESKQLQPIIVKKIRKGDHGAHGGAWKIAYADFVTAMMAFFLLMWLLGSTAKGELQGIESYFNQPVKVSLMGGQGTGENTSILPGGGPRLERNSGNMPSPSFSKDTQNQEKRHSDPAQERDESRRLNALKHKILSIIRERPGLSEYVNQIRVEVTADGLRIDIMDDQKRPMFDLARTDVKPYMRTILREIGAAMNDVQNPIALSGHTDSTPYASGEKGYSNWELSTDRANASRRELVAGGMPDKKIKRISGLADTDPIDPLNPTNAINRRISVVVMTREAAERILGDRARPGASSPVTGQQKK